MTAIISQMKNVYISCEIAGNVFMKEVENRHLLIALKFDPFIPIFNLENEQGMDSNNWQTIRKQFSYPWHLIN